MITATAFAGLPEVKAGDDIGQLIAATAATLHDDDIVVIASKIVAKAQGRQVPIADRETALAGETIRQVAARWMPDHGRATRVVQTKSGPVLVAAGIDASDVPDGPGGEQRVLLLPREPDEAARQIRASLREATGVHPAVLITDTSGRPWRVGVSDFALGAAGLTVLDDRRGTLDRDGRRLDVTVRAMADELAAMADLAKGKAAGTPVAIVRGLPQLVTAGDGPGAQSLVRFGPTDWFSLGADEAVRDALGLRQGPGQDEVAPAPIMPADGTVTADAVQRALDVAQASDRWPAGITVVPTPGRLTLQGDDYARGVAVERLLVALTTVRLTAVVEHVAPRTTVLNLVPRDSSG